VPPRPRTSARTRPTAHADDANSSRGPWRAREPRSTLRSGKSEGAAGALTDSDLGQAVGGVTGVCHGLTGLGRSGRRNRPRESLSGGGSCRIARVVPSGPNVTPARPRCRERRPACRRTRSGEQNAQRRCVGRAYGMCRGAGGRRQTRDGALAAESRELGGGYSCALGAGSTAFAVDDPSTRRTTRL
jgi:hypothetical protein